MNQKLQKCHRHIYCKPLIKVLQGRSESHFSRNDTNKHWQVLGRKSISCQHHQFECNILITNIK